MRRNNIFEWVVACTWSYRKEVLLGKIGFKICICRKRSLKVSHKMTTMMAGHKPDEWVWKGGDSRDDSLLLMGSSLGHFQTTASTTSHMIRYENKCCL